MRSPNPKRIKVNFCYLVHELAKVLGVTRGTVRRWHKRGLRSIDDRKPYLFLGIEAQEFLDLKRRNNKHPCAPGEIYCMRCRRPKIPVAKVVECIRRIDAVWTLIGFCPDCSCAMNRHVNFERLAVVAGNLEVHMTEDHSRLDDREDSSVDSTSGEVR